MMWKQTKLGGVCLKIGSGATPRGGKEAYKESGIFFIRSQNVFDFHFSPDGIVCIDGEQAQKLENVTVYDGDVLINITGDSVARACIAEIAYLPARTSQHVAIIRADPQKIDSRFILYSLQKEKDYLLSIASSGGTRNALTKAMLENLAISLPPLGVQKAIAEILSSLTDKIALNNKINHNLEQQAQAIYKNWFVDFEPFRDREFIDSELGRIPMGWRVGSFTELGKILGGGTPKTNKPQYWEGNIPFFTPKDVDGIYALLTEKSITTEGLANCNSALFPINSVFVTARGTVGKVSLAGIEMAMNQSCYAIYGKEHVGQFFIYGMTQNTVASLRHKSSGAVFNAIVTRDFESERIVIPEISVLQDYEQVVNPIFVGILENSKQSYTLAALRDALLPKLMSGEIDVSNVKI